MTEFQDTDLRAVFSDFADTAGRYVRPPGVELAQRKAHVRIRNRRVLVSAAAAVALLVPSGIIVATQMNGSNSLPLPPATVGPTTPTVTPSPTATPSPTDPPEVVAQAVQGPGELANATLTLSWTNPDAAPLCRGPVTFTDGVSPEPPWVDSRSVHILSTMRLDVDGDGAEEIIAEIFCQTSQAGPLQLVAIRPGANPTTLGVVVESANFDGVGRLDPPDGPGIVTILDYVGLSDGSIRVEVTDRFTCCGIPVESAVVQQRTYRWTGSSFAQVAGPTAFVADRAVADIQVSVPTLVFGAPVDGFRTGTLTVTVRNDGPQPAADVSVYLEHDFGIEVASGGDWGRCTSSQGRVTTSAVCTLGSLAPGQSVTLTLPMRRAFEQEAGESPALSDYTGRVEVRAGVFYYTPSAEYAVDVA